MGNRMATWSSAVDVIKYVLAKEKKFLIKVLKQKKGYKAKKYVKKFPNKNWSLSSLNDLLNKIAQTGTMDRKPRVGIAGGLNPQRMSTDAHSWVKIGFKIQSLDKISNISTSDAPILLDQFQHYAPGTPRMSTGMHSRTRKDTKHQLQAELAWLLLVTVLYWKRYILRAVF